MQRDCMCCLGIIGADPTPAVAVYTTRAFNEVSLCETCLCLWLRNAATDFSLAPTKLIFA